ncbi:13754_t:CDS:1, partial [Racocetra fulgida]
AGTFFLPLGLYHTKWVIKNSLDNQIGLFEHMIKEAGGTNNSDGF